MGEFAHASNNEAGFLPAQSENPTEFRSHSEKISEHFGEFESFGAISENLHNNEAGLSRRNQSRICTCIEEFSEHFGEFDQVTLNSRKGTGQNGYAMPQSLHHECK